MNERNQSFWLGIFVIGALAIAAWLILLVHPAVGDGKKFLRIRFTNIEKVNEGTLVTFAGKPVGEVDEIKMILDARCEKPDRAGSPFFYELLLRVDSRVHIFTYDIIRYSSAGLMGERSIAIIPKEAPAGSPGACEITNELLFAESGDRLERAIDDFTNVAKTFQDTMETFSDFVDNYGSEIGATFQSVHATSDQIRTFFDRANKTDLVKRVEESVAELRKCMDKARIFFDQVNETRLVYHVSGAMSNVKEITDSINQPGKIQGMINNLYDISQTLSQGEGTLGKFLHSDAFYLQITSTMRHFETLLNDISRYGILFQYDKGWQRARAKRLCEIQNLSHLCDFYEYFNQELYEVSISLGRVGFIMERMQCCEVPINDQCFSERFRELLQKVEELENKLQLYSDILVEEKCRCAPCCH